jgi:hypothetical protein
MLEKKICIIALELLQLTHEALTHTKKLELKNIGAGCKVTQIFHGKKLFMKFAKK